MIRLSRLVREITEPTKGSEPLNGKSKQNAKNWVLGKVNRFTTGFFSDDYWHPIQQVWKELDKLGLTWTATGSEYETDMVRFADGSKHNVPVRKTFTFEIRFINNRDKEDTLYGRMVAAGAGSVEEPLERYDVTLTIS